MKNKILNNWTLKIIALIAAILVWLTIVNANDPTMTKTISNIPITVTNEDVITSQNKEFTITSKTTATIVVSGRRSIVSQLEASDFTATAPLTELSIVNAVPVYITVNRSSYRSEIEILSKTEAITVAIEDILTKSYTLNVRYSGEPSEGFVVDNTVLGRETIDITASESLHNLIYEVAVVIDVEDASKDISDKYEILMYTANGTPMKKNGSIEYSVSKVKATTTILKVKDVPIDFSTAGIVAEGFTLINIDSSQDSVKIVGRESLIDNIESIIIPASVLNVDGRVENLVRTIDINDYLPAGTKLADDEEKDITVTAVIEQQLVQTYNLSPVTDIKLTNIPEGYAAKFTNENQITITLRGQKELFDDFEIASIDPNVDLTNAEEGENELEIRFTLPTGMVLVYPSNVKVTLVDEEAASKGNENNTE